MQEEKDLLKKFIIENHKHTESDFNNLPKDYIEFIRNTLRFKSYVFHCRVRELLKSIFKI